MENQYPACTGGRRKNTQNIAADDFGAIILANQCTPFDKNDRSMTDTKNSVSDYNGSTIVI